jgi:hypothetical protein
MMIRVLKFVKEVIIENPKKLFALSIVVMSSIWIFTGDLRYEKHDVLGELGSYPGHYLYDNDGIPSIRKVNKTESYEEKLSKDKKTIEIWDPHPISIIGSMLSILILLAFIISIDDRDMNWNINECWIIANLDDVKTFQEGDFLFYRYKNKLLHKSHINRVLSKTEVTDLISRFNSSNKNLYPDYEGPLQVVRNNKLSQLLGE